MLTLTSDTQSPNSASLRKQAGGGAGWGGGQRHREKGLAPGTSAVGLAGGVHVAILCDSSHCSALEGVPGLSGSGHRVL